jgi:hypothetical protein
MYNLALLSCLTGRTNAYNFIRLNGLKYCGYLINYNHRFSFIDLLIAVIFWRFTAVTQT